MRGNMPELLKTDQSPDAMVIDHNVIEMLGIRGKGVTEGIILDVIGFQNNAVEI